MRVFIDESGDPGFKLKSGSSPAFVVAMVIFQNDQEAQATQARIEECRKRIGFRGEFKFSSLKSEWRDAFCGDVRQCPFMIRAIVIQKERIWSTRLKSDKDKFYEYFVRQMMQWDGGILDGAKVIIDGSGDREFRRNLEAALRKRVREGAVSSVKFKDSANDPLLQLADMCAGAIARSFRPDRPDAKRWRQILAPRIHDVWDFK
jgi:hypothetical protein